MRLPTAAQIDAAINPPAGPTGQGSHLSEHLLLLAEHLAQNAGQLDEDSLAPTLAGHPPQGTTAGGAGTARVLAQVAQGIPWWQATTTIHNGQGSHGSTAAVRAIAAGLLPHHGLGAIADLARRATVITHNHPWARDASAVTATAVALAIQGLPNTSMRAEQFVATLDSLAHHPEWSHHLAAARTLARHRAGPAETIATLTNASSVVYTVPAALTSYLRHPTDPGAAIRYALALGGHTRAIAMITAALSGARVSEFTTPPPGWRAHTQALRIHTAARSLAGLKNPHPQRWRHP